MSSLLTDAIKKYLKDTPEEQLKKDFESLEQWNSVGPTVEEYLNYLDRNNVEVKYYIVLDTDKHPDSEYPHIDRDGRKYLCSRKDAEEALRTGEAEFSYSENMHWDTMKLPAYVLKKTIITERFDSINKL